MDQMTLLYVMAAFVVIAALALVVVAGCALGVYRSVVVIRKTVTALENRKEPAIRIELIEHGAKDSGSSSNV